MERDAVIVAGFGFRVGVTEAALRDALGDATPDALATLADKADHPAFQDFARALGVSVIPVDPADAAAQSTLTTSQKSLALRGTGSVSEACALAAAGPGARLLAPRRVSGDKAATCAIATRGTEGRDRHT